MFQNFSKGEKIDISAGGEAAKRIGKTKEKETKAEKVKTNLFANVLDKKNVVLYIITFLISRVSMGQPISPFGLAMVVACMSYGIPAIGIIVVGLISTLITFEASGALTYMVILLVMMLTYVIREPKYNEEIRNEQVKLSKNLGISIIIVTMVQTLMKTFTLYGVLVNITFAIVTVLFYKIFVNSVGVLQEIQEKKAFSIEEVIGASLLLSIFLYVLIRPFIINSNIRIRRTTSIRILNKKHTKHFNSINIRVEKWSISRDNSGSNNRSSIRNNFGSRSYNSISVCFFRYDSRSIK